MEVTFRKGKETRTVCFPPSGCVAAGRSAMADYQVEDMAVSIFHVEMRYRMDPQGAATLVVRDISSNGTGVVKTTQPGEEAIPPVKDADTAVGPRAGLITPMWWPTPRSAEGRAETLWVDIKQDEPLHKGKSAKPVLPIVKAPQRPATWPKGWASLPTSAQKIWIEEGIEDAHDLANFYTTAKEFDDELKVAGVPEGDRAVAAVYWKDSRMASTTAKPSGPVVAPKPHTETVMALAAPSAKRTRTGPMMLNAPGLPHQQWAAREKQKKANARDAQGLSPAKAEHLQEVWDIYFRAGRPSNLHREVRVEDRDTLKIQFFKPVERYADSLAGRLAGWRRWEAWVATQPGASPFRPTDFVMGKYLHGVDAGGPTAAGQAWHGLKW